MFTLNQIKSLITHNTTRSLSRWHLMSAVIVERLPIIVPEMNPLEKRMDYLKKEIEMNESLYSDHEMRHFEDIRRAERIASAQSVDDKDLDAAAKQTAQDFEDFGSEELKTFTPASRVTKADEMNDQKSLNRCLHRNLFLVCKQRLGLNHHWVMPQKRNENGETMRQTAEKALLTAVGNEFKVKYLGNVPRAVYIYKYPKPVVNETNADGAKIFFFKAHYCNGSVIINNDIVSDYFWLNRNELCKLLHHKYWNSLSQSLLTEDGVNLNRLMKRDKRFENIKNKISQ